MSFSQFTQEDYDVIARSYASLREIARKRTANEEEMALVDKAFEFANKAHTNIRRRSGEPYILHPIEVAKIVVEDIGLGCKSICAALLHDVVEDTDYTVEDIRKLFGDKIASLVDGLTKIKNVLDTEDKKRKSDANYYQSIQAENLKRILLTLNDDIRVVLIKLADRLHNCRTIEYMPEYKRDKILSETMFIFIPLAHRLGLYEIKSEMENIWLRYKEPEAYNDIMEKISSDSHDKEKEIDTFITTINSALTKAGFHFEIRKRLKTPYSIWHKMRTKDVTFEQVYDLYAIRIIFDPTDTTKESERDQCYHVFSIITGIYRYKPDRVRDWVKHPKSNGYEALHVTLLSEKGIWVEVQIRTRRMDEIAEKGIAAHWKYKKEGYIVENDSEMDKWLEKVKEILVNPDVSALSLLDIIHNDLVTNEIVVFTPRGEQKTVQNGATALDFAYMVHTDIGNKAIAAKVNMKLVPLSYVLKTGDQVEIITAEDEHPKKEWLQFLRTRQARNLVLDYFRSDRDTIVRTGREALEAQMNRAGVKPTDKVYKQVCTAMSLKSVEDLFFRFALGLVSAESIMEVAENFHAEEKSILPWRRGPKTRYVTATCCNPIAGDPVIAFRSPDGTVTIHKKTCPIAESLAAKHGDWIVKDPRWQDEVNPQFLVRFVLSGIDRVGLLNEVTRYISLVMEVNIKKLVMSADKGIFEGTIDLWVRDRGALDLLIKKLENIDGIQSVVRTEK